MNVITIDPSKVSTAMVVNGKLFNYTTKDNAYNKSGLSKWYEMFNNHITYRFVEYTKYKSYEEEQLVKLHDFNVLSDLIITDIKANIDINKKCVIGIEGFAFSSKNGALIDLVMLSTLIRHKLVSDISPHLVVISPSTLKQEACRMTYGLTDIGKKKPKLITMNNEGIKGGSFTKKEMYQAIIENTEFVKHPYVMSLKSFSDELLNMKIPKPIEDINDAFLLYYYMLNTYSK